MVDLSTEIAAARAEDTREVPSSEELESLAARMEAAASRDGKPSGAHMIDGQRMIAKIFRSQYQESGDQQYRDLADVADCMAHCIENEALLFECLKTECDKAIDVIRAIAKSLGER